MGWPVGSYEVVRIRTPEADEIRRYLAPRRRLVILSRDGSTTGIIGRLLGEAGFGPSALAVLADLGSPSEARWDDRWPTDLPALHVLCVTCRPDRLSSALRGPASVELRPRARKSMLQAKSWRRTALQSSHLREDNRAR